jgi:hypothetical protein
LLLCFPSRVLLDLLTLVLAPLRNEPKRSWAIVMAYGYLLAHLPAVLKKRLAIQAQRTMPDRDLEHVIFPGSLLSQVYFKKHLTFRQIKSEW